ncbi:MAG TPA: hypothetical protein EYN86_06920 [Planctomycetes bacterium]|jgi:hypothetical protein|nr:hypothetical protein [Planctomycetota bacterium]
MDEFPNFDRSWLPYIYLYGVGGILFLGGMFLIFRSKACDWSRPTHRRWAKVLIFGYFWYATLHGVQIYAALNI